MLNNPFFTPLLINNGNSDEWSPIWSVIIQVINKLGQGQRKVGAQILVLLFQNCNLKLLTKQRQLVIRI